MVREGEGQKVVGRFGRELGAMTVGKLETLHSNNAQLSAALRFVAVRGQGCLVQGYDQGPGAVGRGSVSLLWL